MEFFLGFAFVMVGLSWVVIVLPQQRRVRAHQQVVMSLQEGDEVILTAGIHGRITHLGPEELDLEVAPGVELRVARQAVLRRVVHAVPTDADAGAGAAEPEVDIGNAGDNNAERPDGDHTTL
jgi:preprotein translocase subunit YajC